jgi:hypothetical protein
MLLSRTRASPTRSDLLSKEENTFPLLEGRKKVRLLTRVVPLSACLHPLSVLLFILFIFVFAFLEVRTCDVPVLLGGLLSTGLLLHQGTGLN